MLRLLSLRICELCTKTSPRLTINRCTSTTILGHLQRLDAVVPSQCDLSLQFLREYSNCRLSTYCVTRNSDKNDDVNYSQDPEVRDWLREMQNDFSKEHKNIEDKDVMNEKQIEAIEYKENQKKSGSKEQMTKTHPTTQDDDGAVEAEGLLQARPPNNTWAHNISQKYKKFDSSSSEIIYDYNEEQLRREEEMVRQQEEEEEEEEIVLKRGETGVFDVEELVDLLREENAKDIAVIQVPQELRYVDHMVIVSSHSQRHICALAELIRQIYKKKKHKHDPSVNLEGKGTDWVALDIGNIALHIMTSEMREDYDLETLWTVGSQYDDKCQQQEENFMDMYNLSNPLAGFTSSSTSFNNKSLE
ncbi:uncharacterized protein LOC121861089 [Homarus americanus]|uniref:Mitochondrial assembly of ribosomal large subunit protein 1 n=1 Tax=Homarus americanus TaxID=6706 RepID=A0A8J5T5E8_HOMAM|nr:uncharacterized protein LOC121861089 [Homarus americanus]KAG7173189.1 Mitochondrial assembly of ribosomal large subunit protein 1-like [Homarus americanus]